MTDAAFEPLCSLCGHPGPFFPFFPGASLRETRCPGCASSRRNRDVIRVLLRACGGANPNLPLTGQTERLRPLRLFELQAQGPLHALLSGLPGYVCSEYFPDIRPGDRNEKGILCQDASCLSFADASFDLVINQDIFEHMPDPWSGFAEIGRVLCPGGKHIFTVPLHEGRATRQRARLTKNGEIEHLLPPVRHKDPLNPDGALVFWDYGRDLPDLLRQRGIAAHIALYAGLHPQENLCDADKSYEAYLQSRAADSPAGFFIYNSVVFVAETA